MPDLPRSPREALIEIDSMLAGVLAPVRSHRLGRELSGYAVAFDALAATVGPSGRPVGSGDPGGGKGATIGSSVERAVMTSTRPREDRLFERLVELPSIVMVDVVAVVREVAEPGSAWPVPPSWAGQVRQLAWSRWAVRALHHADRCKPSTKTLSRLQGDVVELDRLVVTWSSPGKATGARPEGLVRDLTGRWCTSCLRVGRRVPRSHRYPTHGLCRWCGDWHAVRGWLPTRDIVDAHHEGHTITAKMIKAAKPPTVKPSRKRARS